jgi:hypothetical protein
LSSDFRENDTNETAASKRHIGHCSSDGTQFSVLFHLNTKKIREERRREEQRREMTILIFVIISDRLCSVEGVVLEGKLFTPEVSFLFTRPTITQEIAKVC